jgi:prepilin-type N-terminal cleavage/methylation domain-containing protein
MKRRAFTLVELLVVIAIIGLLSTVAVVALNTTRVKARDTKRIADVRQIAQAFALASNDVGGSLPTSFGGKCLGLGDAGSCWSAGGLSGFSGSNAIQTFLQSYMSKVPNDPQRTSGKGDRYVYMDGAGHVAYHCTGGASNYRYGPMLIWSTDSNAPATDAECGNIGFYACCETIDCSNGYFCAYQLPS